MPHLLRAATVPTAHVLGPVFVVGFLLWAERKLSWAELRQASVKGPAKGELSSAYASPTVENQTQKRTLYQLLSPDFAGCMYSGSSSIMQKDFQWWELS